MTFAFVCVDKGSSRAAIVDLLIGVADPIHRRGPRTEPQARWTHRPRSPPRTSRPRRQQTIRDAGLIELQDQPDDVYHSNIQISELNALNAAIAVVKFKQLRGFYGHTVTDEHHVFTVAELKTYSEGVQ